MIRKGIFKKPKNALEGNIKLTKAPAPNIPDEMCISCPACKKTIFTSELLENLNVCGNCGHHFRINSRQRINIIADKGTFCETDSELVSKNVIDFPGYDSKLDAARLESAEKDAVVCGTCKIGGFDCCLLVMEPYFMMGSMGIVVGEKTARLFEYAAEKKLPVIGFAVSGGARMQEGILSLMQMAKTSAAVRRHSDGGNLYVSVLTDPTTGGVTASFAMEGDIILSEPGALVGFAGPRVIEQTMRQKLPAGFQRAEFMLEKGFIDEVVDRRSLKEYLKQLLRFHVGRADHERA